MSLEQQMTDIESRVGRIESLIAILRDALINDRDSDKYDGCDNSVSADNLISHKFPPEYILDLYETLEGKLYDKYLSDQRANAPISMDNNLDNSESFLEWLETKLTDNKFKTDLTYYINNLTIKK